jgi:hypothetical protein
MVSLQVKSILPKFGELSSGKYKTLDDSKNIGLIVSLSFATILDPQDQRQPDGASKDAKIVKKAEIERH